MLLISSLILSGCGPEPEDKKSQQQQSTTPTDQQVLCRATSGNKKWLSKAPPKPLQTRKALAQQEVQQYSDKQALLGRLQAAPKYQHAAREKAASQIANPATARYQQFDDNPVKQVAQNPLATFSLDVDTGQLCECAAFFL